MNTERTENADFLSGFIAIAGPPNAGKSTLLNCLLGSKVAIVSPKPQTTRNRILGILNGQGFQMAFMDTPGIHKTKTLLHKSMVSSAQGALNEVDIIMLVIDTKKNDDPAIPVILKNINETGKPCVLVLNKIDLLFKDALLPIIRKFSNEHLFSSIIPVSAQEGDGVDLVVGDLKKMLKPGPAFFPEDMKSDQPEDFIVSEIIREKIYFYTRKELPYSSAVTVARIEEVPEKDLVSIAASIHVESESQKAIMIGHSGKMIKDIGRSSRLELEKLLGAHVYLDLVVKVEKNWSRDTRALRRLGY